jgi:hypothetical protein
MSEAVTSTPRIVSPHRRRFWFFVALSIIGLVTAGWFNGLAVMQMADYGVAWFAHPVDWVLSADLLIVAVAAVAFMIWEAKRLGMKHVWLYIVLSGVTAMACTFPFFLAMRERALGRQERGLATPVHSPEQSTRP